MALSCRNEVNVRDDTIYMKLEQSVQVVNKKITIGDIAQIQCSDYAITKQIGKIIALQVKGDKNQKCVISSLKLIELIRKEIREAQIVLVGEPDVVVEYHIPEQKNKALEYTKLFVLTCIVFFGSAFTIMTFNTDVSVGDLFNQIYQLVMGQEKKGASALELFYSIGIPLGILGFYNHFSTSKVKEDPTPIHIEMRNYEEEMNKAIIADASREGSEIS